MGTLACDLGCFPFDNGAYPPLSHSRAEPYDIRSLVGFGKLTPPSPSRALPSQGTILEAAPKCISEKTSYRRVRLAYHLYPQLIPSLCNVNGFGPSPRDYRGFSLAIGSSHGFGSNPRNPRRWGFTHASTRSSNASARIFIFEPKFALSDLCVHIFRQRFVVSFLPGRCPLYSNLLSLRLRNVIP